jgi:hypothetical protein
MILTVFFYKHGSVRTVHIRYLIQTVYILTPAYLTPHLHLWLVKGDERGEGWVGALMLRPPTKWPCDFPTHMKPLLNIPTTVTIQHTTVAFWPHVIILQRHFAPNSIRLGNQHPLNHKSWTFCHCIRTSTFFYLDSDRTSTFALKQNVDILSHVTWAHLEVLWLVWWEWTKCHNGQNRGLMMGLTDTWISWACALPNPLTHDMMRNTQQNSANS